LQSAAAAFDKYHLLSLLRAICLLLTKVKLQKRSQHNDELIELLIGEERPNGRELSGAAEALRS